MVESSLKATSMIKDKSWIETRFVDDLMPGDMITISPGVYADRWAFMTQGGYVDINPGVIAVVVRIAIDDDEHMLGIVPRATWILLLRGQLVGLCGHEKAAHIFSVLR